jgi:hypothetical protein
MIFLSSNRLPVDEGDGFLATALDLPGCMSDGATPEESVSNVQDAIAAWIEVAHDLEACGTGALATLRASGISHT